MARPVIGNKGSKFIVLASVCIVVAALYFASDVLIPLVLAILFCFLLAPFVRRLERWKVKRVPAVIIVVSAGLGIVAALAWVVSAQVLNLGNRLPDYKDEIVSKVRRVSANFGHGGPTENLKKLIESAEKATTMPTSQPASQPTAAAAASPPTVEHATVRIVERSMGIRGNTSDAVPDTASTSPEAQPPAIGTKPDVPVWVKQVPETGSEFSTIGAYIAPVISPLATGGLVIVFVIFMLLQREDLRNRMIRLIGHGQLHVTTTALDDAATRISRYLVAQSIVNGTYGIAIAGGLWLIGLTIGHKPFPSFVLWGLLCAVLRFVPYIGPWIGAIFPITLSLAVYPGFGAVLATLSLFVLIELLSNNFMEPWLYGSSTGLSTVAILVSAVFWTWLWGGIGLLLATPLTVCLVVLGKHVPQLQFLDILLGDEQVLEPPQRVYQRLLALDQEEAVELAREHLKKTSLEQVYDEVLLPALALAEQDRHRGRLGEERERFVIQAMRAMVDELADVAAEFERAKEAADVKEAAAANVALAKGEAAAAAAPGPAETAVATNGNGNGKAKESAATSRLMANAPAAAADRVRPPQGCTVNIVCLPARDDGDDVASVMLAQLLVLRGYCAFAVPVAALAGEMVAEIEKRQAHIAIVSALPPGAISYSRYLCKRVHARYPQLALAVGLWTLKGDLAKAKERVTCDAAVPITTTLTAMLDMVHQLAQPIIVQQTPSQESTKSAK